MKIINNAKIDLHLQEFIDNSCHGKLTRLDRRYRARHKILITADIKKARYSLTCSLVAGQFRNSFFTCPNCFNIVNLEFVHVSLLR